MERSVDKYEILSRITDFIHQHNLEKGDRLPSEREFADKLKTSRAILRQSLELIEGEIVNRKGQSGTFILSVPNGNGKNNGGNGRSNSNLISAMILAQTDPGRQEFIHDYLLKMNFVLNTYLPGEDNQDLEKEKAFLESLVSLKPRGLLATATPLGETNDHLFELLTSHGVKVAHVEYFKRELPRQPFFLADSEAAGFTAVSYLVMKGIKTIYKAQFYERTPSGWFLTRGVQRAADVFGINLIDTVLSASGEDINTEKSTRAYQKVGKDSGIIVLGGEAVKMVLHEIYRVHGETAKTISVVGVGDYDPDWNTYPLVPFFGFSWTQRAIDALEYIVSERSEVRNRLYKPTFFPVV